MYISKKVNIQHTGSDLAGGTGEEIWSERFVQPLLILFKSRKNNVLESNCKIYIITIIEKY